MFDEPPSPPPVTHTYPPHSPFIIICSFRLTIFRKCEYNFQKKRANKDLWYFTPRELTNTIQIEINCVWVVRFRCKWCGRELSAISKCLSVWAKMPKSQKCFSHEIVIQHAVTSSHPHPPTKSLRVDTIYFEILSPFGQKTASGEKSLWMVSSDWQLTQKPTLFATKKLIINFFRLFGKFRREEKKG